MKKLIVTLSILFGALSFSQAQNDIAVVNQDTTAFFHTISAAITYSTDGDTIYLPGRSFAENLSITKQLFIFGTGHYIDSTQASGRTEIYGSITLNDGASGGLLHGLYSSGSIGFGTYHTVNNYTIERCNFSSLSAGYLYCTGLLLSESVIRGNVVGKNTITNVLIEKNIIIGEAQNFDNASLITNNVFLQIPGTSAAPIHSCHSCIITNNVFMSPGRVSYTSSGCNFTNNLMVSTSITAIEASNSNTANVDSVVWNSIFVNYDNSKVFSYDYDFHLQGTSVGVNLGSDGTNVGIYGTSNPYKPSSVPLTPHVYEKSIARETDSNGMLSVQIKAAAQQR